MNVTDISELDKLIEKLTNPNVKNAYHYTSLETLFKIYENKTLHFSRLKGMNDEFESTLFGNCRDYFFCLSKSDEEKENFGMWAMYGRLNASEELKLQQRVGVKILFPNEVIKDICERTKAIFHRIAYTDLIDGFEDSMKKKFLVGSQSTGEVSFESSKLEGYVKDSSWRYENELRIRYKWDNKNFLDSTKVIDLTDENLNSLRVYPSPYYSIQDCEEILDSMGKLSIKPVFAESKYRNSYKGRKTDK